MLNILVGGVIMEGEICIESSAKRSFMLDAGHYKGVFTIGSRRDANTA